MEERRATRVLGVTFSPGTHNMVVLLEELEGDRVLPIWIGEFEGSNIEMALRGVRPIRPFPYDLILDILQRLQASVERVSVTNLKENTFYASVEVIRDSERLSVDARPSDAIALAVRTNAPIFVAEAVLKQASIPRRVLKRVLEADKEGGESASAELTEEEMAQFKEFLSRISPEEFKKFKGEESSEE